MDLLATTVVEEALDALENCECEGVDDERNVIDLHIGVVAVEAVLVGLLHAWGEVEGARVDGVAREAYDVEEGEVEGEAHYGAAVEVEYCLRCFAKECN